ncbi:MAG: DUF4395 domain-containing protein [Draconibacterium sp.]
MKQIICPISNEKINEQVTRLNAILAILLIIAAFAFQQPIILFFLVSDFFIRAFTKAKYSPVSFVSHRLTNTLNLGGKAVDKAPKIFAARIGFLMLLTITILSVSGLQSTALLVAGIFVLFAALEFALAICVGCIIYTYLVVPFNK